MRQLQDDRARLEAIDTVVTEIAALSQSSHRTTDDAVRQLHVGTAGNTLHTGDVNEATNELADLTQRRTTLRHGLTADTDGLLVSALLRASPATPPPRRRVKTHHELASALRDVPSRRRSPDLIPRSYHRGIETDVRTYAPYEAALDDLIDSVA